jgi:hypothetical protein
MGFDDGLDGKKGLIIVVIVEDGRSSKKPVMTIGNDPSVAKKSCQTG